MTLDDHFRHAGETHVTDIIFLPLFSEDDEDTRLEKIRASTNSPSSCFVIFIVTLPVQFGPRARMHLRVLIGTWF